MELDYNLRLRGSVDSHTFTANDSVTCWDTQSIRT